LKRLFFGGGEIQHINKKWRSRLVDNQFWEFFEIFKNFEIVNYKIKFIEDREYLIIRL